MVLEEGDEVLVVLRRFHKGCRSRNDVFLIFIAVFGFYAYRTFVEMYAIEKSIGTVDEVAGTVETNIKYWVPFYNLTSTLTGPESIDAGYGGRKLIIWVFLVTILFSIYFALLFLLHGCWLLHGALILIILLLFLLDYFLLRRRRSSSEKGSTDSSRGETPDINIHHNIITVINQRLDSEE